MAADVLVDATSRFLQPRELPRPCRQDDLERLGRELVRMEVEDRERRLLRDPVEYRYSLFASGLIVGRQLEPYRLRLLRDLGIRKVADERVGESMVGEPETKS